MSDFVRDVRLGARGPVRTTIVVLNFGGPTKSEEVEPFLYELFRDPDVIRLPFGPTFQEIFARRLSKARAPKVIPQYEAIGGSPIIATTLAQVAALERALGPGAPPIRLGMRYTEPSIAKLADELAKEKPDRVVALALYPHYSDTTTGSSFNAFADALAARGLGRTPVTYVPAFYDHPKYLEAMKLLIEEAAGRVKDRATAHLLFSAHGLPAAYVQGGDPYQAQVQETVRLLVRALGWSSTYSLAFQSKVGPARWLEPSTEHEIHRLASMGARELIVVPVSFVSDHIETLYEIDVTFKDVAAALGLSFYRTRALDTHPSFIACLADVLRAALADDRWEGLGEHRCVRCLHPKPHEHRTRSRCADCGHSTPRYLLRLPPIGY